jgi:hypothetical protein
MAEREPIEQFQFGAGKWQVRLVDDRGALAGVFKFNAEAPDLEIGRLHPPINDAPAGIRTVLDLPEGWGVMFIRLPDDAFL